MTDARSQTDRLTDQVLLVFALWTLLCHLGVVLGANLAQLVWGALALFGAGLALRVRRTLRAAAVEPTVSTARPVAESSPDRRRQVVGMLIAVGAVAAHLASAHVLAYLLMVIAVAVWWLGERVYRPPADRAEPTSDRPLLVWGLAIAAILLTAVLNVPDLDDSFYVGLSVMHADSPQMALMSRDPIYDHAIAPVRYNIYTLELLSAALAHVSGVPAIYWAHFLVPSVAALLVVFVYARLFRRLTPGHWALALVIVLLIYTAFGGPEKWYSNFGLIRLHQGKGILVTVLVPLAITYALEYARGPTRATWGRLALLQIAALGATSSSFILPAVVLTTLLSATGFDREGFRKLGAGLAASFYPLIVVGVLALAAYPTAPAHPDGPPAQEIAESVSPVSGVARTPMESLQGQLMTGSELVGKALERVLPTTRMTLLALIMTLVAALLARRSGSRRLVLTFSLVFLLGPLNPLLAPALASTVLPPGVYWRVFWFFPLPLFMAMALLVPVALLTGHGVWLRRLAAPAILAVFFVLAPHSLVVQKWRDLSWFQLKVGEGYRLAQRIAAESGADPVVLAPYWIAGWIPTLHNPPRVVGSRRHWFHVFPAHEQQPRRRLMEAVSGLERPVAAVKPFLAGVRCLGVTAIMLGRHVSWDGDVRAALAAQGFRRIFRDGRHELWRVDASGRRAHRISCVE